MTISVLSLITTYAAPRILQLGLGVATSLGLPVTSWRTGDPTKSLYHFVAEILEQFEGVTSEFIKAGFLETAEGDWLTVLASEVYGIDREEATYATPTVTVTNTGGGYYPRAAGDLVFKSSTSNKTYTTTSGGTLSPGATVTFSLVADEAGADSSAGVDEIDEMVTGLLGVSVVSSTAALAVDEQSDDELKELCRASRGALSPNGPADAYVYVALNNELTGMTEVNRAKATGSVTNGAVSIVIASASGAVAGATVTAVQNAVETWATPLCITPTVVSAAAESVDVEFTVEGTDLPSDWEDRTEAAVVALFASSEIGAKVAVSRIIHAIHDAVDEITDVNLIAPASDVVPGATEVPVLDDFTASEV